jgi:hypothetical protein
MILKDVIDSLYDDTYVYIYISIYGIFFCKAARCAGGHFYIKG